MEEDLKARLDADFGDGAASVANLLSTYAGPEPTRVLRCVVVLAERDAERIRHFVEAAKEDYRDVIYWAEYDQDGRRVRDFTRPFAA